MCMSDTTEHVVSEPDAWSAMMHTTGARSAPPGGRRRRAGAAVAAAAGDAALVGPVQGAAGAFVLFSDSP